MVIIVFTPYVVVRIMYYSVENTKTVFTASPTQDPSLWHLSPRGLSWGQEVVMDVELAQTSTHAFIKHLGHALTHTPFHLLPMVGLPAAVSTSALDRRSRDSQRLLSSEPDRRLGIALTLCPLSAPSVLFCPLGLCGIGTIPKSMPADIKRGKQCRKQMPEANFRSPDQQYAI